MFSERRNNRRETKARQEWASRPLLVRRVLLAQQALLAWLGPPSGNKLQAIVSAHRWLEVVFCSEADAKLSQTSCEAEFVDSKLDVVHQSPSAFSL